MKTLPYSKAGGGSLKYSSPVGLRVGLSAGSLRTGGLDGVGCGFDSVIEELENVVGLGKVSFKLDSVSCN